MTANIFYEKIMFIPTELYMSSAVHTGLGHGYKRINKSRLDCLEHNDRTYIHCYAPLILEIMTEQEIKEELCYYDLRNPDVVGTYGMTKEELKEDGYGNHARKDCSCDNCFYGRTKMAEELLRITLNVRMKETAIDWFVDELQRAEWIPKDSVIMNSVIAMAKEIEKEQIVKAFDVGLDLGDTRNYTGIKYYECKYILKVD